MSVLALNGVDLDVNLAVVSSAHTGAKNSTAKSSDEAKYKAKSEVEAKPSLFPFDKHTPVFFQSALFVVFY